MEWETSSNIPLRPRPTGRLVPLTAMQLRMLSYAHKRKTFSMRMVAASLRIAGPLDAQLLRSSIDAVVARHETLRTRIVSADGVMRQAIDTSSKCSFKIVDLIGESSEYVERKATEYAQEFIERRVDPAVGPLFEALLLKLFAYEHVLILALDHLVSDGVSYMVLKKEIWALYGQFAHGQPASLPELPVQFSDYAVWQEQTLTARRSKHEAYWREHLTGVRGIQHLREAAQPAVVDLQFPFAEVASDQLRDVARRERTLPVLVLLTAYIAAISNWCNQNDVVVAVVSHGRLGRPELRSMIGLLVTHLYLRVEIRNEDTFRDLLGRIKIELNAAYSHQDFDPVPDILPEHFVALTLNWVPTGWTDSLLHNREGVDNSIELKPFRLDPFPDDVAEPVVGPSKAPPHISTAVITTSQCRAGLTIKHMAHNFQHFLGEFARNPLGLVVREIIPVI